MPPKKGNNSIDAQRKGDNMLPVSASIATTLPTQLPSCKTPEKDTWTSLPPPGDAVASPSAEEFLRMILIDMQDEDPKHKPDEVACQEPSEKQINFADFLGMEMNEWQGITRKGMSNLINPRLEWQKIFKDMHNDFPASGLVKECLRFKNVEFDNETLTRTESMKLFEPLTKGARLLQMRTLRYSFKVPVDILLNLTDKQSNKVISRMTKERDEGGLRDVPKRALFDVDDSNGKASKDSIEDSPGKRLKQV